MADVPQGIGMAVRVGDEESGLLTRRSFEMLVVLDIACWNEGRVGELIHHVVRRRFASGSRQRLVGAVTVEEVSGHRTESRHGSGGVGGAIKVSLARGDDEVVAADEEVDVWRAQWVLSQGSVGRQIPRKERGPAQRDLKNDRLGLEQKVCDGLKKQRVCLN